MSTFPGPRRLVGMTPITLQRKHIRYLMLTTVFAVALTVNPASMAMGRQDSGPPAGSTASQWCPVERVGTQIVRCDDLSGAGVSAPLWLPEVR
jgi:hypothetical protein